MVQDELRWREVPECSGLFSFHASHCPEMDRWESQEADWLWGQRSLQISGAGNTPDLCLHSQWHSGISPSVKQGSLA